MGKDPDEFVRQAMGDEALAEKTDDEDEEDFPEEPPEELEWVWNVFQDLDRTREYGDGWIGPVSFVEMRAWAELHLVTLDVWEVSLLRDLDDVRREVWLDGQSRRTGTSGTE